MFLDDEFYYDDDEDYDDALDGLEINLEELLEQNDSDLDPKNSAISALKKSITDNLINQNDEGLNDQIIKLQTMTTNARGLPKNTMMYINDINDELTGKKGSGSYSFKNVENIPQTEDFVLENEENKYEKFDNKNEVPLAMPKNLLKRLKLPQGMAVAVENLNIPVKNSRDSGDVNGLKSRNVVQYSDNTGEAAHVRNEDGTYDEVINVGDFEKSIIDESICICQRCYKLQQYGTVEESLRPGWSDHELLTPERFENLLSCIRETEAVVLCIVDVFDLKGSLLKNLKQIAGTNPIVIAANKVDLLPKDVSAIRLTNWIHAEVKEFCDLRSPKEVEDLKRQEMVERGWHRPEKGDDEGLLRRANVHLVSCQGGVGMNDLMQSLMGLASDNGNKVYVMGAANVGKSSFINRLLESDYKKGVAGSEKGSGSGGKKKDSTPQATVSNLPGTTLNFLKIKLPNGVTMIDTPGLINRGQLTSRLTTEELRQVIIIILIFVFVFDYFHLRISQLI